jgi:hypothetical protein
LNNFVRTFYYSNFFYGLCSVALCIETNLQHGISLNSTRFYLLVFLLTVVYYSRIYYQSSKHISTGDRSLWYRKNRAAIKAALFISKLAILLILIIVVFKNFHSLQFLKGSDWLLLLTFPLLTVMYSFQILPVKKLRMFGWLKPFIIGFVWCGVVTIFPILLWHLNNQSATIRPSVPTLYLALQNFLFISVLAIVFDIKDYGHDKQLRLNTYPALYGITTTVHVIIVPLTLLCLVSNVAIGLLSGIGFPAIIIQSVPYLILLLLTKSLSIEKPLLFYLAAIDGLMFLKAIAGIISTLLF